MENTNIFENSERNYKEEILEIIRSEESAELLSEKLFEYHDNDIAAAFEELSSEEREKLYTALGIEAMSDILAYTDEAGEYLSELSSGEAADIIEMMDADDAIEILDTLEEDKKSELLELIEDEAKEEIELIDSYGDDEFGSRMSRDFISVAKDGSIKGH